MQDGSTRRSFLWQAALAGAGVTVARLGGPLASGAWASTAGADALKVLVLGGTGQTGPHLIRELLGRGHTVTMFNRGNRSEDLFPDVECLIGDRAPDAADGLQALEAEIGAGRRWDLAIDIWPHVPQIVERTATLLHDSVDHFMYVSSISVYADHSKPGADETAEVGKLDDPDAEYSDELFGPFKAECEKRVRRIYPDNHTIFRPGLIVGPRDFSFRGVYWPVRVRRGGEVLAPGDGSDFIQIVDGRDLTAFQADCMERRIEGTFNVTGEPTEMRTLLETCRDASGADARFTWVDAEFLSEHQVAPWMHMPCWLPAEGEYAGFGHRSIDRARKAGLRFRALAETVRDTLVWYDELPTERRDQISGRAGLPAEREAEVLKAWHEAQKG